MKPDSSTEGKEPPTCEAEVSTGEVENCGFTKPVVSTLRVKRVAADGGAMYSVTGASATYVFTVAGVASESAGAGAMW